VVQVGALAPLEVITWPAEPVEPAKAMVEEISMVVTFALAAVVAPIVMLLIVPNVAGLIVNVPVPVGAIEML